MDLRFWLLAFIRQDWGDFEGVSIKSMYRVDILYNLANVLHYHLDLSAFHNPASHRPNPNYAPSYTWSKED